MSTFMKRLTCLTLTLTLLVTLGGCKKTAAETPPPESETPEVSAEPTPTPEPTTPPVPLVAWGANQVVEHIFFHPVIAYPQWAFHDCPASQEQRYGLDDWMVTVDEYNKILQNLYDKDYIIVSMNDVWSEVDTPNGPRMQRNTLMVPEGKKPLIIESKEGENEVVLEAPAGLIRTKAIVKDGKVESVTLTNVPSFVYKENQKITVDGKEIEFTISFGGSFFALVDTTKLDIGEINPKTVPEYTKLGMKMLEIINRDIPVKHPLLDITSVDLVEFYGPTPNPEKATMRNVVIFGDAMADRSPCGTGTSAKLATLHHWGEIKVGEEFIYESFIGSLFKGVIKETAKVGDFDAVIPMITGSCYLTGVATYLIDQTDPLKYGFQGG